MAIVYVESNTTGFGYSLLSASEKYDKTYFFTRDPGRYPILKSLSHVNVVHCDTGSHDILAAAIQQIPQVRFVATTSDDYLNVVARLGETIGTIGNSSAAVSRCRDKLQLQEILSASDIAYPRTIRIQNINQRPKLNFPIVVKPRAGTGSINVRLIVSDDQLSGMDGEDLICQEFIKGKEFSVESFTDAGGHHVLGITRKFVTKPPYFLELGHVFPANIDGRLWANIVETVCRALDAVGYTFGPAHTEVKVINGRIYIIEINARLAGGMIPRLMEKSSALSLPDLYIRSYLAGSSQFSIPRMQLFSSVMFVLPKKGQPYIGINFPDECEDAGVFREEGVNAGKFDFSDRAGYVISVAQTEFAALRKSVACRNGAIVLYALDAPPISANTVRSIIYEGSPLDLNTRIDSILAIEKAHLLMLLRQSIIGATNFHHVREAVLALEANPELIKNYVSGRGDYYDYEHYIIEQCGLAIGGMIQVARSRNDINSTHLLFVIRQALHAIMRRSILFVASLIDGADRGENVLLPIYSQFQTAMPGSAGHYLVAHAQIMLDTMASLMEVADRLDISALGACAGAGTSFNTDSQMTATLLGFESGPLNSLSVIMNKNGAQYLQYLICEISANINRIAIDFQIWSMREINILTLPDGMYGGSSNMPQKRNPYVLEWLRCGHERNIGRLLTLISTMSHLPSGNSYQASKIAEELTVESSNQIAELLTVVTYAIRGAQFSPDASRSAISRGDACATLGAEMAVQKGIASFREAHSQVSHALRDGQRKDDVHAYPEVCSFLDRLKAELESGGRIADKLAGGGGPAAVNTKAALGNLYERLRAATRWLLSSEAKVMRAKSILDHEFRRAR